MAESWVERLRREAREVHAAVDELLASDLNGGALRAQVEAVGQRPHFNHLAYRWGPWLWRKQRADLALRVALRPFLLSHLDGTPLTKKGEFAQPWSQETSALEAWLAEVDRADDVEVLREVLQWKLRSDWKSYSKRWRALLLAKLQLARTPTERQRALSTFDFSAELDEATAREVYERVGPAARRFILERLPWQGDLWEGLHRVALERHDDDTAWQLYRRQVTPARWAADVRALVTRQQDPDALVKALEQHHPQRVQDAGPVFVELAEKRGGAVLPYLQRHVRAVFPRWGWFGRSEGKGLKALITLADRNAWTALWARLLQTSATPELWNQVVKELLQGAVETSTVRQKLLLLAGAGGEWNFSGFGLAQVQPLSDEVACLMYERARDLLRGPFRMHLPLSRRTPYPKLLTRVLADDDEVLVGLLASRAAMDTWADEEPVNHLAAHFEAMPVEDGTFIRRATDALALMPAYAIWRYEALIEKNRLARLLFERSTGLYLGDARLVRELLESPQIHVQALGFRVLATKDPRAGPIAAAQADLLAPTLLRPLHRRTRLAAFGALEAACLSSEAAGAFLLRKMKDALALPDRRYPKEELVALMGQVLHRWPALRQAREQPRVYRREVA